MIKSNVTIAFFCKIPHPFFENLPLERRIMRLCQPQILRIALWTTKAPRPTYNQIVFTSIPNKSPPGKEGPQNFPYFNKKWGLQDKNFEVSSGTNQAKRILDRFFIISPTNHPLEKRDQEVCFFQQKMGITSTKTRIFVWNHLGK